MILHDLRPRKFCSTIVVPRGTLQLAGDGESEMAEREHILQQALSLPAEDRAFVIAALEQSLGKARGQVKKSEVRHALVGTTQARADQLEHGVGEKPIVLKELCESRPFKNEQRAICRCSRVSRSVSAIKESDLAEYGGRAELAEKDHSAI